LAEARTRAYGQYCGLARAAELVGERWALLIIRDLLVGPRRFTDLRRGLPRIPTNVLSDRLKELEENGIVRRRVLPRPAASVVYELTDYGQQLEEVVMKLGLWGAQALGEPRPDEIITTDSIVMALRSTFVPEQARGLRAGFELRLGEITVHARVDDGSLAAGVGGLADPDVVLETGPAIKAIMAGEVAPTEALANGSVRLSGPPELFDRFAEVFQIPRRASTS
jgi:DNA-binding HxlR family transcriptional regulator